MHHGNYNVMQAATNYQSQPSTSNGYIDADTLNPRVSYGSGEDDFFRSRAFGPPSMPSTHRGFQRRSTGPSTLGLEDAYKTIGGRRDGAEAHDTRDAVDAPSDGLRLSATAPSFGTLQDGFGGRSTERVTNGDRNGQRGNTASSGQSKGLMSSSQAVRALHNRILMQTLVNGDDDSEKDANRFELGDFPSGPTERMHGYSSLGVAPLGKDDRARSSSVPCAPATAEPNRLSALTPNPTRASSVTEELYESRPRRTHRTRAAKSAGTKKRAAPSLLDVRSALTPQQMSDFHDYMESSPTRHRLAQLKVLELTQFWITTDKAQTCIAELIAESMQRLHSEPKPVRQAWGAHRSPSREEGRKPPSLERDEPQRSESPPEPGIHLTSLLESPPDKDEESRGPVLPVLVSQSRPSARNSRSSSAGGLDPRDVTVSPRSSTSMSAELKSTALPFAGFSVSPSEKAGGVPQEFPSAPVLRTPPRVELEPGAKLSPSPGTSLKLDELTRRKSPVIEPRSRSASPAALQRPAAAEVADADVPRTDGSPTQPPQLQTKDPPPAADEAGGGEEAAEAAASAPTSAAPPENAGATYDEIPRFYFPEGKPTTRGRVISGPLSQRHANPHLKLVEGIALPPAVYDVEEGRPSAFNESLTEEQVPHSPKQTAMVTLRSLDDRVVHQCIQKEFTRLPAPPKSSQKIRLVSGRLRRVHGNSSSSTKHEVNYRAHLVRCIRRLCTQCFGIPGYFAFVIIRLIQADITAYGGSVPSSRTGQRSSASLSLLQMSSSSISVSGGAAVITAGNMRQFYDIHLRNKDGLRRTFDLLMLSSTLLPHETERAGDAAAPAAVVGAEPNTVALASRRTLLAKDFVVYLEGLLAHHPGLTFLQQTPDFQSKYLDTVIYRIFYELDRYDRGCITFAEFAASRLMDAFRQVDASDDINAVLLFFSYEHFYVLYCSFWELDEDRDMMLSAADLMRYVPENVINPLVVQRVFAGVGRRVRCTVKDRITYEDFVWFCLSEEDKATATAIRYWFRILDVDGDGILSVYEMQMFYEATKTKIQQFIQDGLISFEDVLCQVFDMMRCSPGEGLRLAHFLAEPEAAAVALNMLTNVVKFLQFEQQDPFVAHQERLMGGLEQSAWDRFARVEYDRMAQEADD